MASTQERAWLAAHQKGSKALVQKLDKVHANNPAYQAFKKKHGLDNTSSVKQVSKSQVDKAKEKARQALAAKAYGATKGTKMGGEDGSSQELRDTTVPLSPEQHSKVKAAERAAKPVKEKKPRAKKAPVENKPVDRMALLKQIASRKKINNPPVSAKQLRTIAAVGGQEHDHGGFDDLSGTGYEGLGSRVYETTVNAKDNSTMKEENKNDVPFAGPYKKKSSMTKDKSGAVHTGSSVARDLARKALKKVAQQKEEVEQVDEMIPYALSAANANAEDARQKREREALIKRIAKKQLDKDSEDTGNPFANWEKIKKEEVEQIDEIEIKPKSVYELNPGMKEKLMAKYLKDKKATSTAPADRMERMKARIASYKAPVRANEEVEQVDEAANYTLKHVGTSHPKDVTDDEDQPVKATEKSYEIHKDGKKVGELEHHYNEYGGHFYSGNLHGRRFPWARNNNSLGGKNDAHSYLASALKSKWHTSKHGATNEEVEQVDEVNSRHSFVAAQARLTPRAKNVKDALSNTRRAKAATNKYGRVIGKIAGMKPKEVVANLKSMGEEVEQIDELSSGLLRRYGGKAARAYLDARSKGKGKTAAKRAKGVNLASAKSFPNQYKNSPNKAKVPATNEEVEQIDELKKSTLASYITKASRQSSALHSLGKEFDNDKRMYAQKALKARTPKTKEKAKADMETSGRLASRFTKKAQNRTVGISRAAVKLAKEEVEQVSEVLKPSMGASAYISDFVRSKNPKFEGKSKKERINMALGAYYSAKKGMKEALDPVGREDADVNNDGKHGHSTDKYLLKRRAAISKAIASKKGK